MRSLVRKMGNSSAVLIPRPLLNQIGAKTGDEVSLVVEGNRLVIEPILRAPREGWAEDARDIAAAGDDALVWPEFGNDEDAELQW
jgi:antitoxin MazE